MYPRYKLLASSVLARTEGLLTPHHRFNTPEADEFSAAVLVKVRKVSVNTTALLLLLLKSFLQVSLLEKLYYQCQLIFALGNFVQLAFIIAKLGCLLAL